VPAAYILVPIALLAGAGLVTWALSAIGRDPGRLPAAAAAWLALGSVAAIWLAARTPLNLAGPALGAGVKADLRLDALSVVFLGMILFAGAVLLSGQPRASGEAGAASLALAGCCLAVESAAIPLTALALGISAVLLMLPLRAGDRGDATESFSLWQAAGWILLLWAAANLQVTGGTAAYDAVPVTSFGVTSFLLLAGSALLVAGLTPWRSWRGEALERADRAASWFAAAAMPPVGFFLLLRAYDIGGGRYPNLYLNLALVVLGAWVAAAAALRAQAAPDFAHFRADLVLLNSGIALFALGLGSPLGVAAAITVLLAGTLQVTMLAMLPEPAGMRGLLAALLATGVPPSLAFGGRLLALQAGFEAGEVDALAALVVLGAWMLTFAGAARAVRLPRGRSGRPGAVVLAAGVAFLALVLGAGLGFVEVALAIPAAAEAVTFPTATLAGGALGVSTTSGAWPALAFGLPLLILGGVLLWFGRGELRAAPRPQLEGGEGPRPLLGRPWAGPAAAIGSLRNLRIPDEYRSLFDPRALDAAVSAGHPLFWLVVVGGLAYAITR
jgi:hypothetical protein